MARRASGRGADAPEPESPHHLTSRGPENGVYVRIGSTNRHADPALIAEMARSARHESFDETPMITLDPQVLDFPAAAESFRPARALRRRDLTSLGCLTDHQGRSVPTAGGVLLFGRDRLACFPDAWLQAGSFAGVDRSQILDQLVLDGPLPDWVEESIRFVDRHSARAAIIDGPRRRDVPALPAVAVRVAIVNAVVHADYSQPGGPLRVALFSDRLEVENPSLLPFGLTINEIQLGVSRVRNRVLARVFRELGYVEQWRSGIQRMTRACVDADHPPPEFTELAGRFRMCSLPPGPRSRRRSTWTIATSWTRSPTAGGGPPRNLPRRWAVDADNPQPTGQARGAGPAGGDRKQRERPTPPLLPPQVRQWTGGTSRLDVDQRSDVCRASGSDPEHVFLPVGAMGAALANWDRAGPRSRGTWPTGDWSCPPDRDEFSMFVVIW